MLRLPHPGQRQQRQRHESPTVSKNMYDACGSAHTHNDDHMSGKSELILLHGLDG